MNRQLVFGVTLLISQAASANSLDKEPFKRAFNLHRPGFSRSYVEALTRRPQLETKVVFKFSIFSTKPLGVELVEGTGDDAMDTCLIAEAKKIQFPESTSPIFLSYPLTFKSAND